VVLTDIDEDEGKAATEAIRAGGGQVTILHHDVATEPDGGYTAK
jgi:hypothetical protein